MYRISIALTGLAVPLFLGTGALAEYAVWVDGQNMRSPFMRVYKQTLPPVGHISFCRRYPKECLATDASKVRTTLTPTRWKELTTVNTLVNRMIKPVSDEELYGKLEHWTYPERKGDCEDYVLLKQRLLQRRGWPESALLITVVTDEDGAGHAVLTVRTSKGDFLLDNKSPRVVTWNKVPYRFYKRQSYRNPKVWISLLPTTKEDVLTASGAEDSELERRLHASSGHDNNTAD